MWSCSITNPFGGRPSVGGVYITAALSFSAVEDRLLRRALARRSSDCDSLLVSEIAGEEVLFLPLTFSPANVVAGDKGVSRKVPVVTPWMTF